MEPVASRSTLEMPTLGRPFTLGMLYDCRSDTLIPGITMWKREELDKGVSTTTHNNTTFEVLASDRISDKSSALHLSASLKVSFLCGLVEVGGSGKFLRDMKNSEKQARVTLKYTRSTRFEQLGMNHLSMENMAYQNVFTKGTATHVVTGILYGAQAYFVFDQEVSPQENATDISGNLQSLVRRIPQGLNVPQINHIAKETDRKFRCTFHGDFALERNPVNYEDAVKVYSSLPQLLGPKGEKAVPIRVWLHPLNELCSKAAQLVQEISDNVVFRVEEVVQEMADVNTRCNDLLNRASAATYPEVKSKIRQFREHCHLFTLTLQKQLAQALPSVRGGQLREDEIVAIFTRKEQSPFSYVHITDFLNSKEQEMDVVESYVKGLGNINVVATENELRQVLMDKEVEYTMCFNFASLNVTERYLSHARHWLQTNQHQSEDIYEAERVDQWFKDKGLSRIARLYVKQFQAFADVNKSLGRTQFVVSSVLDTSNPGISIYLYQGEDLENITFQPPSKPNLPRITDKTHNSIELVLQPAEFGKGSIEGFRVEYRCTETNGWVSLNTEKVTLSIVGLKANSYYQFRYSAVCKAGFSQYSEVTAPEKTLPTSPPVPLVTAEPQSITMFWNIPDIVGDGVTIEQYGVQYKEEGADTWLEKRTGRKETSCVLDGLKTKTMYKVLIRAVCGASGDSKASDEVHIVTPADVLVKVKHQIVSVSRLLMTGDPTIYQIPYGYSSGGYRMYTVGKEEVKRLNKVILLLGDAGKTTLIDAMANYILGVDWEDDFRFRFINTESSPPNGEESSQVTEESSQVTVHKINYQRGYQVPYSLTVIDVPHSCNNQGVVQVRRVMESIHEFLITARDIDSISAICFVVEAQKSRLTPSQNILFHALCSMFGEGMKDHFMILAICAGGQKPPVVESFKAANIPNTPDNAGDPVYFIFNDSALFTDKKEKNVSLNKMFWSLGRECLAMFFTSLGTMEDESLDQTKEVLKRRKILNSSLQELVSQVHVGLVRHEEMRKAQISLQQNRDLMEANEQYETEEDVCVETLTPIDGCVLTCSQCDYVCHYPCQCKVTDGDRSKCSAMNKKGFCTVCPNKCKWDHHYIQNYGRDYIRERQTVTHGHKKAAYDQATAEVKAISQTIDIFQDELSVITSRVPELTQECYQTLQLLKELSLAPDPLLSTQYIDRRVEEEQEEASPGYSKRIEGLQMARLTAEIVQKIEKGEDVM